MEAVPLEAAGAVPPVAVAAAEVLDPRNRTGRRIRKVEETTTTTPRETTSTTSKFVIHALEQVFSSIGKGSEWVTFYRNQLHTYLKHY